MRIRYIRCIANFLVGFFTGMSSVVIAERFFPVKMNIEYILIVALLVGIIQGGLAFSQELKREIEREENKENDIDCCGKNKDKFLLF